MADLKTGWQGVLRLTDAGTAATLGSSTTPRSQQSSKKDDWKDPSIYLQVTDLGEVVCSIVINGINEPVVFSDPGKLKDWLDARNLDDGLSDAFKRELDALEIKDRKAHENAVHVLGQAKAHILALGSTNVTAGAITRYATHSAAEDTIDQVSFGVKTGASMSSGDKAKYKFAATGHSIKPNDKIVTIEHGGKKIDLIVRGNTVLAPNLDDQATSMNAATDHSNRTFAAQYKVVAAADLNTIFDLVTQYKPFETKYPAGLDGLVRFSDITSIAKFEEVKPAQATGQVFDRIKSAVSSMMSKQAVIVNSPYYTFTTDRGSVELRVAYMYPDGKTADSGVAADPMYVLRVNGSEYGQGEPEFADAKALLGIAGWAHVVDVFDNNDALQRAQNIKIKGVQIEIDELDLATYQAQIARADRPLAGVKQTPPPANADVMTIVKVDGQSYYAIVDASDELHVYTTSGDKILTKAAGSPAQRIDGNIPDALRAVAEELRATRVEAYANAKYAYDEKMKTLRGTSFTVEESGQAPSDNLRPLDISIAGIEVGAGDLFKGNLRLGIIQNSNTGTDVLVVDHGGGNYIQQDLSSATDKTVQSFLEKNIVKDSDSPTGLRGIARDVIAKAVVDSVQAKLALDAWSKTGKPVGLATIDAGESQGKLVDALINRTGKAAGLDDPGVFLDLCPEDNGHRTEVTVSTTAGTVNQPMFLLHISDKTNDVHVYNAVTGAWQDYAGFSTFILTNDGKKLREAFEDRFFTLDGTNPLPPAPQLLAAFDAQREMENLGLEVSGVITSDIGQEAFEYRGTPLNPVAGGRAQPVVTVDDKRLQAMEARLDNHDKALEGRPADQEARSTDPLDNVIGQEEQSASRGRENGGPSAMHKWVIPGALAAGFGMITSAVGSMISNIFPENMRPIASLGALAAAAGAAVVAFFNADTILANLGAQEALVSNVQQAWQPGT